MRTPFKPALVQGLLALAALVSPWCSRADILVGQTVWITGPISASVKEMN